jgi:hypothetical protein
MERGNRLMAGDRRFTRIPPESTGDRVRVKHSLDVLYNTRTNVIAEDSRIRFTTSGIVGTVIRHRVDTATTGLITVNIDKNVVDSNASPQQSENIVALDSATQLAKVAGGDPIDVFANVTTVVGYDDQYNGLFVDRKGAAAIRFGEGEATLDSFGKLRVSNAQIQGDYAFPQGVDTRLWTVNEQGSATITHDAALRAVVLTNTPADGDLAQYTSDQYHHYVPGVGQTTIMTVALGDTGKTGLDRSWGYFDDANGTFFRDNDGLEVVVRSSVTGTVEETVIAQTDWNKDTLDGSSDINNPSNVALDKTADNIYWFDMQWLGAGRIRFGVYINGERLIVHEYYHGNRFPYPNMQTGSLPVRVEQRNTAVVGSTSQMKFWCAGVLIEADIDITNLGTNFSVEVAGTTSGAGETFIGAARPVGLWPSGDVVHNLFFPKTIGCGAWDSTAGTAAFVKVSIYQSGFISGGDWIQKANTLFETNLNGTIAVPGLKIVEYFVNASHTADVSKTFANAQNAIKNKADGTQQIFYFTAQKLVGANDISVQASVSAKDVPN